MPLKIGEARRCVTAVFLLPVPVCDKVVSCRDCAALSLNHVPKPFLVVLTVRTTPSSECSLTGPLCPMRRFDCRYSHIVLGVGAPCILIVYQFL